MNLVTIRRSLRLDLVVRRRLEPDGFRQSKGTRVYAFEAVGVTSERLTSEDEDVIAPLRRSSCSIAPQLTGTITLFNIV
jgi:hypothetical protein